MSLFTAATRTADLTTLRRDRLAGMATRLLPNIPISDDYLFGQLLAAENLLEMSLRIFFSPREIVPDGTDPADVAAIVAAGGTVVIEPGYDYTPELFDAETWGLIQLRQQYVISITSLVFNYPQPNQALFTIPTEWIRCDRKYGVINLVPTQNTLQLPLNAFLLEALGGGRSIPLLLQCRYSAGLQNARTTQPALMDTIFKQAALNMIDDQFLPQSSSISQDGGSQSLSVDADKYRERIESRVDTLRGYFQGIQFVGL